MTLILILFLFQYYEMSYGLNIEMHKQVKELFPFHVVVGLNCYANMQIPTFVELLTFLMDLFGFYLHYR